MKENEIYTIKRLKCAIKTRIIVFYCDLLSFALFLRSLKNVHLRLCLIRGWGMAGDTNVNVGVWGEPYLGKTPNLKKKTRKKI